MAELKRMPISELRAYYALAERAKTSLVGGEELYDEAEDQAH